MHPACSHGCGTMPTIAFGQDQGGCAGIGQREFRTVMERRGRTLVNSTLFGLPEVNQVVPVVVRLIVAAVLGGLLGAERESVGKAAGLRTHMLVALGSALFVIAPAVAGLGPGDLGRIIQGIAAGIG